MDIGSPTLPGVEAMGRLRDGTLVHVRGALPSDRLHVAEFLRHVTKDSLELRFLGTVIPDIAVSEILTPYASEDQVSLLLEIPDPTPAQVIAHGEYIRYRSDPTRAEVAFLVADDRQGQGAATLLLQHLARRARAAGIWQFDAITVARNRPMLDVFLGIGFPCSVAVRDGLGHVSLDISHEPATGIVPLGTRGTHLRLRT
ncbi:MAG: GNAT family N-acetyltransferase [Thermoplasmata archaeon]